MEYVLQAQDPETNQWIECQRENHTESGRAILDGVARSMPENTRIISFGMDLAPEGGSDIFVASTFPAKGDCQCYCGRVNGVWYTWTTYSKRRSHGSRKEAFEAHDQNISFIKYTFTE